MTVNIDIQLYVLHHIISPATYCINLDIFTGLSKCNSLFGFLLIRSYGDCMVFHLFGRLDSVFWPSSLLLLHIIQPENGSRPDTKRISDCHSSLDTYPRGKGGNKQGVPLFRSLSYNHPYAMEQIYTVILNDLNWKKKLSVCEDTRILSIYVTPLPFSPVQFQDNCYFNGRN